MTEAAIADVTGGKKKVALSSDQWSAVCEAVVKKHPDKANVFGAEAASLYFKLFDTDCNNKLDASEIMSGVAIFTAGSASDRAEKVTYLLLTGCFRRCCLLKVKRQFFLH